jgi:taurine dioxygenase
MPLMTSTATDLHVTPRAGHLGADVTGVDLSDPFDAETRARVRALLDEYLVLFFPGQQLNDDEQLAFALQFGEPYVHPIGRANGRTTAGCEHIVDDAEHPPYQDKWHTDVSWDSTPPVYGTLRAIDLPPKGGDTIWASMYAAYDALSPAMQQAIDPLHAEHTMGSATSFITKAGLDAVRRTAEAFPPAVHPVVGVHPNTGRKYLNVNGEFTASIVGMTPAESRAVLGFLTGHAAHPNFQMRHSWRRGDVVIWDERCTQHFAVADYVPARREMGRVAVV